MTTTLPKNRQTHDGTLYASTDMSRGNNAQLWALIKENVTFSSFKTSHNPNAIHFTTEIKKKIIKNFVERTCFDYVLLILQLPPRLIGVSVHKSGNSKRLSYGKTDFVTSH